MDKTEAHNLIYESILKDIKKLQLYDDVQIKVITPKSGVTHYSEGEDEA